MPPQPGEHGRLHSLSESSALQSAPTPHFRRPAETPFGKIQPDFDGFALAEMSDWLEPPTPAPFSAIPKSLPPDSEAGSYFAEQPLVPAQVPQVKRLSHRTPDTQRRRRSELFTPCMPIHQDDLFSRRLADSARRTPLAPLPVEQFAEPAGASRPTSSLAMSTVIPPESPKAPPPASRGAVVAPGAKGLSRAERARAAGIPVLSSRARAVPSSRPKAPQRRLSTPTSIASLAASASTLDGRPEFWDLSMATPTAMADIGDRSRELKGITVVKPDAQSAVANRRLLFSSSPSSTSPQLEPSSRPVSRADDAGTQSGSIFGFLTSLFITPPAASLPPPAPLSPPKSSRSSRMTGKRAAPLPAPQKTHPPGAARKPLPPNRGAPMTSSPPKAASPRAKPHRRPLGEMRGVNVTEAKGHPKRKEPPSPVKEHRAPSNRSATVPAPSYARPTSSSRSAAQPAGTKPRSAVRSLARPKAPIRPFVLPVTSFVAQHLARMPKPGEGATASGQPVSIADHERAREMAIRKAMFERAPKVDATAPAESAPRRVSIPTQPSRVPGEATRRRAEVQAANRERREQKASEETRIAAEEARIRAEVEAELDRQARQATVVRARPLPEMYSHRHA